jgi:hypothetical protein
VTDLLELAARVEAADGPSQDLNLAIWRAVNPNGYAIWEGQQRGLLNKQWDEERRQVTLKARARVEAKPFTTSLDAAMQLVPEGCHYTIEPDAAWVRWLDHVEITGVRESQAVLLRRDGKCTALALCAAALRARAADGKGVGRG